MAAEACPLWLVVGVFEKGKVPSKPTVGILRTVVWKLGVEESTKAATFQELTVNVRDPFEHHGSKAGLYEAAVLKIPEKNIKSEMAASAYVKNSLDWFTNTAILVSVHALDVELATSNINDPDGFFCVPKP